MSRINILQCDRCLVNPRTAADKLCDKCRALADTKVFKIASDGERIAILESQVKQLCELIGDLEPITVFMTLQDGKQHQVSMLRIKTAEIRSVPSLVAMPPPETEPASEQS